MIEGDTRIATGAVVFNGARLGVGAQLEFHSVVFVNTVVPAGTAVPMGWFAGGDPAALVPPSDRDRIRALMGPLDYAGTVFGVSGGDDVVPDIARRYTRSLALHQHDQVLPPGQHERLDDGTPAEPPPVWAPNGSRRVPRQPRRVALGERP